MPVMNFSTWANTYYLVHSVASLFQTFLDRQLVTNLANNDYMSSAVMMGFAYVLSLCSEADAFVASSFSHTFSPTSSSCLSAIWAYDGF